MTTRRLFVARTPVFSTSLLLMLNDFRMQSGWISLRAYVRPMMGRVYPLPVRISARCLRRPVRCCTISHTRDNITATNRSIESAGCVCSDCYRWVYARLLERSLVDGCSSHWQWTAAYSGAKTRDEQPLLGKHYDTNLSTQRRSYPLRNS